MPRKILIIIPARGGSKGIPRKNLRPLNGKPLIYYSIQNALSINNADVYVSSEDKEILMMASKFGAKLIERDPAISEDSVTLDPVIHDAFFKIKKIENKDYDCVITMQPTSPLLEKKTIISAIEKFFDEKLDTIISGTYDSHLTWIKKDNRFFPNYEKRVNRQELPEIYKETGGFLITKAELVTSNSRIGSNVQVYPINKKEAIDIDNFDDWSLCEFYLKRKKILFVVSGNREIGLGHVYNTLSIANEILNHEICFLVDHNSKLAQEKIIESNYRCFIQKSDNIVEDIHEINPHVIINDILDTSEDYMNTLSLKYNKIINFEDLGVGAKYANLVVNAMYPEQTFMKYHYFGSKYFILRDEFLFTRSKIIQEVVSHVLISFGGVDPNNYTFRTLKIIYDFCLTNNIKIHVITGLGYNHDEELTQHFPEISLKKNVFNISDEILNSDLVFTSAGRTTFEIASIGTPAIILCQNERESTHFFASHKNGFCNLGLGYKIEDDIILSAFKECLKAENRISMSKLMLAHNLKKGKKRVLNLIKSVIEHDE